MAAGLVEIMRTLRMTASWQRTDSRRPVRDDPSSWRFRARCAEMDPDLFFPVGVSNAAIKQAQRAKRVCAGCPVQKECLDWAQTTNQTFGVWGGFDEEERAAMRGSGTEANAASVHHDAATG